MNIIKAEPKHFEIVREIVHSTIKTIYPKYYPKGVVDEFLDYHSDDSIQTAIAKGQVYLLEDNGHFVATASKEENQIGRLYVLPAHQGLGFGTRMMEFLENAILASYGEVKLDASLPAQSMYLKRGYEQIEYHKLQAKNGDYCCYFIMRLKK